MEPVSRRRFVIGSTAGLAGILAARVPPARGQQREISYLCWNNFAPASDKKLAEIGQRFELAREKLTMLEEAKAA